MSCGVMNAQVVGDASLGTYNFTNDQLFFTGPGSQYAPMVFTEVGETSAIWTHGTSPNSAIFHTELDATTYLSSGSMDTVVGFTGVLNSDGDGLTHQVDYESGSGKFLDVYRFADNLDVVNKDFSVKGKLFTSDDFSETDIVIEGPMDFANDLPFWWRVCNGPSGEFGVVYHSDGGSSTSSKILFKTVDGATGVVSPAASANTQTGHELTFAGATFADVAYNETAGVYGVVFITGTGNNTKIKFVSVNSAGTVVTSEKDVIADNSFLSKSPRIESDGDGFVIVWTDFRNFQIPNETLQSGKPMSRIAQLTATGDLVATTGTAPFFDAADNSLILSNPYEYEVYDLRQELVVVTPREKYGVIFTSQNAPYETYVVEAQVTAGVMNAMVPVLVSDPTLTTDQPSIAYDATNSKYVVGFQQYTGSSYENRISSGTYSASGTNSIEENGLTLSLFPNPANSVLNVQSDEVIGLYQVYDALGNVLVSNQTFGNSLSLNVSSFSKGIYFLKVEGSTQKFIVD